MKIDRWTLALKDGGNGDIYGAKSARIENRVVDINQCLRQGRSMRM